MEWSPVLVIIVLLGLVGLGIFLSFADRAQNYDERQLLIRAKAYRLGFITMLTSVLALMFLQSWDKWNAVVDSDFGLLAAAMFSLMVFGVYCVLNDAYFTRTESPLRGILICSGVILMNVGAILTNWSKTKSLFVDGRLTFSPGGNALCVGMFVVFLITIVIKSLVKPKEDDE